jgi:hypothetical protein
MNSKCNTTLAVTFLVLLAIAVVLTSQAFLYGAQYPADNITREKVFPGAERYIVLPAPIVFWGVPLTVLGAIVTANLSRRGDGDEGVLRKWEGLFLGIGIMVIVTFVCSLCTYLSNVVSLPCC